MEIINFHFSNWYTLVFSFNWLIAAIIVTAIIIVRRRKKSLFQNLHVNEVRVNFGAGETVFQYDYRIQEAAYKIWVELNTRKIGIPFEEDSDVIKEVYASWYTAFTVIRSHIEEIPVDDVKRAQVLIDATINILNNGLRPHLTKWQAKYQKWYDEALKTDKDGERHRTPQEIQKDYPEYDALIADLKATNAGITVYSDQLKKIAFEPIPKDGSARPGRNSN